MTRPVKIGRAHEYLKWILTNYSSKNTDQNQKYFKQVMNLHKEAWEKEFIDRN